MFPRRQLFIATVLAAVLTSTGNAQSQAAPTADGGTVAAKVASGPRLSTLATGIQRTFDEPAAAIRQQPVSMGRPMALMIVGGAAFILGAVVKSEVGDLFMIGGAVSFLIGLYQYIR